VLIIPYSSLYGGKNGLHKPYVWRIAYFFRIEE